MIQTLNKKEREKERLADDRCSYEIKLWLILVKKECKKEELKKILEGMERMMRKRGKLFKRWF